MTIPPRKYKYVVLGFKSGIRIVPKDILITILGSLTERDYAVVVSYPESRSDHVLKAKYKRCQDVILGVKSKENEDVPQGLVAEFMEEADFIEAGLNELEIYRPVWPMGPILNNLAMLFTHNDDPFYTKILSEPIGAQWFTAPVPGFGESLKFTFPADLPGPKASADTNTSAVVSRILAETDDVPPPHGQTAYSKDEVLTALQDLTGTTCFHFKLFESAYDFYFKTNFSAYGHHVAHLSHWNVNGDECVDVLVVVGDDAHSSGNHDMEQKACGCPRRFILERDYKVPTIYVDSY